MRAPKSALQRPPIAIRVRCASQTVCVPQFRSHACRGAAAPVRGCGGQPRWGGSRCGSRPQGETSKSTRKPSRGDQAIHALSRREERAVGRAEAGLRGLVAARAPPPGRSPSFPPLPLFPVRVPLERSLQVISVTASRRRPRSIAARRSSVATLDTRLASHEQAQRAWDMPSSRSRRACSSIFEPRLRRTASGRGRPRRRLRSRFGSGAAHARSRHVV